MARITGDAKLKRGRQSRDFIFTMLGFALTIETGVVALIEPLYWPYNLLALVGSAGLTIWLFLYSNWFRNMLFGWKGRHEER